MISPSREGGHRRVLITGGSGFIGTNVVEGFMAGGADVLNVDVASPMNARHAPVWRQVDILDREALTRTFVSYRPDFVIHLAARADLNPRHGLDWYAANTDGVANVIYAILETATVERSIFASSRLVFDLGYEPKSEQDYHASTMYGRSKAIGEELVRTAPSTLGTWMIVRPTGIWGPWFGEPYRDFFRTIERGLYAHPGRHPIHKGYGYVENTVHQICQLAAAPRDAIAGRTFWLADYPPLVVRSWAESIRLELGARAIPTLPPALFRAAGKAGDLIQRFGFSPPLTSFRVRNMLTDMVYDTAPLESLVGPLPYDVETGVRRTVEWLREAEGLVVRRSSAGGN